MEAKDVLTEELTLGMQDALLSHNCFEEFVVDAMIRYADLTQSANMERILDLETAAATLLSKHKELFRTYSAAVDRCAELEKKFNPDKK